MGVDIGVGVDTPNNRCIGCRCRYTYTYIYIQHPFFGCTIVCPYGKKVLDNQCVKIMELERKLKADKNNLKMIKNKQIYEIFLNLNSLKK